MDESPSPSSQCPVSASVGEVPHRRRRPETGASPACEQLAPLYPLVAVFGLGVKLNLEKTAEIEDRGSKMIYRFA
jgi:hypothetical protein